MQLNDLLNRLEESIIFLELLNSYMSKLLTVSQLQYKL